MTYKYRYIHSTYKSEMSKGKFKQVKIVPVKPVERGVGTIYCGDNLKIMKDIPDESVDLIYLDPPFFSGRNYEDPWKDGAGPRSFKDTGWYRVECPKCDRDVIKVERFCPNCGTELTKNAKITRKNDIYAYIDWMVPRLKEMHRILKITGSIYLHVDWHAVHYLKVEMDRIFGMDKFHNEIIWYYTGRENPKQQVFPRNHDTILFYTKNARSYTFNVQFKSLNDKYVKSHFTKHDTDGRVYRLQPNGKKGHYKQYLDESKGSPVNDVWEIQRLNSMAKERLGYPTQKPEALLNHIIKTSSNKGDIVFDPFCGCGTTVAKASNLLREYIGIDISPTACRLIANRINYPESEIIGMPYTLNEYHKMEPNEFQDLVCSTMHARNTSEKKTGKSTGADGGIDGIIKDQDVFCYRFAGCPIQVKRSKSTGINTIKNFKASMELPNEKIGYKPKKVGFIVALSFGPTAEKVAKQFEGYTIHLIKAEDLNDFSFNKYS